MGMIHNGDHLSATGLLTLGQDIAKEPVRLDKIPGIPEDEL